MYKTVRHGENSLQYKILAQQEEGVGSVKCRKSPRTVTAKLITVIILLIVGIIASAVLVPLVLTNDFIALTGTFQKFSVSTLRRSHSGNHVVVIAKKPYGWNGLHSNLPSRTFNASRGHANDLRKSTAETEAATAAAEASPPTETTKATAAEGPRDEAAPDRPGGSRQTERPATETTAAGASGGASGGGAPETRSDRFSLKGAEKQEPVKPSPTTTAVQRQKSVRGGAPEGEGASSTAEPVWFEPVKKWGFGSSDNFIDGMNGMMTNPVSIFGIFLFVVVVIVMFFILRKTLPRKRTLTEKERAESKEDKTRLLRPSSDHEEE